MTTLLDRPISSTLRFAPRSCAKRVRRIGIIGAGDVTRNKIWKAVERFHPRLDGIVVCSREPQSPLQGMPHRYYALPPNGSLPMHALYNDGFLSDETLWIVATPSDYHIPCVLALAQYGRVAIEKPLASCVEQAEALRPYAERGDAIYPIDHKLFNRAALDFVETCRMDPSLLDRVARIEATFLESAGFRQGRCPDDCIADIQWHLFVLTIAFFKTGGAEFAILPERVCVARHGDPGSLAQVPSVCTATRIGARLHYRGHDIACDFRQAKGASHDEKWYRLYDEDGILLAHIDLNESGWAAHARTLHALLEPVVDMRHDLTDALEVVALVQACQLAAVESPDYPFGHLPSFLR